MNNNERILKLTPEQYKELRLADRERQSLNNTLNSIIKSLVEEKAKQDEEFWEQVYELAGESLYAADVQVRWITQDLVITPMGKDTV